VFPAHRRIEIVVDPNLEVAQRRAPADDGFEIAEADRPTSDADVPQPFRTCEQFEHATDTAADRPRIAVARSRHGKVDGEEERPASGLLCPGDHVAHEGSVLD